ncbi:hypothetical protein BC835DRAFT_1422778 [Cytidiella melzeri]|nr:hypothetical protein BC835DRAFT_1422778 [Cytidiella melzeri]
MPASSSVTEPAVNHPCYYCGPQEPARCPERAADLPANPPRIFYNSPNLPITVSLSSPTPEPQQDNKSKLESYQDSEIDYNDLPRHTIARHHEQIRLIPLPFELYEDRNNFHIQNTPGPALLPQPCKNCKPRVYAIVTNGLHTLLFSFTSSITLITSYLLYNCLDDPTRLSSIIP